MVLLSSHRIPRVLWYSGYTPLNLYFAYRGFTFCAPTFQLSSTIQIWWLWVSVTPINITITWFGLFPVRSPLLRKSIVFFLFLRVLRCFSSPGSLPIPYVFRYGYHNITCGGFPHSEICGSQVICTSPQLIAACHVLLRRLVPRHPPYALYSLISS